jgi:hypothetical protein
LNSGSAVVLAKPLPETEEPPEFIGLLIRTVFGIVGSLALAVFIGGRLALMLAAAYGRADFL